VALGRELLGGNGILSDFLVAKVSFFHREFTEFVIDIETCIVIVRVIAK